MYVNTGPALGGGDPNWEDVYCNVLCVLDKLRGDYTLVRGPFKRKTQFGAVGPTGLRPALSKWLLGVSTQKTYFGYSNPNFQSVNIQLN